MPTARLAAALLAVSCALVWGVRAVSGAEPEPEHCPPKGPPTGLTLEVKDFGGTDRWIEIEWTAWEPGPSYDTAHYEFVRWEVQRKAPGGEFAELPPGGDAGWGLNPDYSVGYALNYFRDAEECAGTCALTGETYSYRVRAHYKYRDICLEFDGATYPTNFSNEASITVPGGPPAGAEPPTNVIAVGHTKKKQVDVTWTPPAERPDRYVIKRRLVSAGPGKTPRADAGLVIVGKAPKTARKFTDRRVVADAVYEYVVEAIDANVAGASVADVAYAVAGRFRSASFREVPGEYAGEIDGVPAVVAIDSTISGRRTIAIESSTVAELSGITFDGTLGGLGTLPVPKKSTVLVTTMDEVGFPEWSKDLIVGHKGKLSLAYTPRAPFDPLAFRTLEANLVARPGLFPKIDESFRLELQPWVPGVSDTERPTTFLYASCASGNTGPVPHTGNVAVVYRLISLGPAPLFANRLDMFVSIAHGEFIGSLGSDWFEFVDSYVNDDGLSEAHFRVGAIGPVSRTKSEIATLVFQIEADVPLGKDAWQTGVGFRFSEGTSRSLEQEVFVRQAARTIEIPTIRPAGPAKR